MQPQIEKTKKHKTTRVLAAVSLLVLVIALGLGGWLLYQKHSKIEAKVYKYQKLDSYTLGTSKPAITFDKPVELHEISKTSDQAELEHVVKGDSTHRGTDTYIGAAFVVTNVTVSDNQLQDVNKILQSPNAKAYSTYVRNINTFVNDRTPTGWKNSLGPAKQFTNGSIKSGAWLFGLTSSYPSKVDRGEILYIIKGNANYYFLIESTQQNWDYNQQIWPQVLDSISVN